jgi:type IV pilus assembly protein PilW
MESRCLVEGIEDLQFEFGIDSNGDGVPDHYLEAPSQNQLYHAVTVRIHLLIRSIASIPGWVDGKTYLLGRKSLAAREDRYLRRVLSTTVLLRNRARHASLQGARL